MPAVQQQLKGRYAVLGGVVVVVLGILLVKLWTMQVLHGEAYASDARGNRVRQVTYTAPRGRILDRQGRLLVSNKASMAVYVDPGYTHVTKNKRRVQNDELFARLSAVLGVPVKDISDRALNKREQPLAQRMVALSASKEAVAYISEHPALFPGVEIRAEPIREYPHGSLAAHVLGYTGEVTEALLSRSAENHYQYGDIVGKAGAELEFETVLQGDRGVRHVEVDARGRARRVIENTDPTPGHDVVLTIDTKVQKVTEKALAEALVDAKKAKFPKARAGAAVAIDVRSGEVIAMASLPTYDPSVFLDGISKKRWASLNATESGYPLTNRAIAGQYPAASTFKAMTGLGGLKYGLISESTSVECIGSWNEMGKQWKKMCWNHSGHGWEDFHEAVKDSCDSYFYHVGYLFYKGGGGKLQKYARSFGFGEKSGVDIPGELSGRMPDAEWKNRYFEDYPELQRWQPGDEVNLSIGQGDLLVTPLQIANAYAGIANGGKVMKPHVLKRVVAPDGKTVLASKPSVAFDSKTSASDLAAMRGALLEVTQTGTGKGAFAGFPVDVAGKTGTAQVAGKDDYAWFVGFAPAAKPKYAVAVLVEQGGHGGSIAGPAARQIFAALLGEKIEHVSAEDSSR